MSEGFLRRVFPIRRGEWSLALPLFLTFFLTITTFWILKPLKKGLFIGHYQQSGMHVLSWQATAAQAELVAKIANMVVAFFAAMVFTVLAKRLRRQQLVYLFSAFFAIAFVVFAWALRSPSGITVWSFYLFGDLYSTVMVATFFAFANDSVDPDMAKRLYGVVGLGGVAGGAFGSSIVSAAVAKTTQTVWLLVCLGIAAAIAALSWLAARAVEKRPPIDRASLPKDDAPKKASALEGARLVFRSPYLLAIVAIVGIYEMVSTIMDFQFTSAVQRALEGPALSSHFARVFALTNWVALFVQLFVTSWVMRRYGLTVALLVLPVAASLGSSAFLLAPTLLTGSLLNTADNAFSYSINQSAKEALYVPTTRDEKYKAKAFIDMFVQRFAKSVAVLLSLGISTFVSSFAGVRLLSIATLALLAVWALAARRAGREFDQSSANVAR